MKDVERVSGWFVLKSGFKVQVSCPVCHSSNVSYYCHRRPGLRGISHLSHGFTPACLDCGKNLPNQREIPSRKLPCKNKKFRRV